MSPPTICAARCSPVAGIHRFQPHANQNERLATRHDPPFSGHSRETPNLVARLQSLAGVNGGVVDAASCNLIRSMFNCVDFGLVTLKGSP